MEEREIIMAIDYQTQLNKIKEAQKQSAIADLENTRNQALSDLEQERTTNAANFNTQRNQANIQNQLAAKNFKEYLVNSGRANSGIMPQYEMNRQNNLQRSINDINSSQNMALADINRRNTLANQTYNTGLQSANANIEAQYLNNLLAQQQQEWQRQMQEKEFNEKVRQYNENMAWQKQQYQDQLSRQSLGRSYSSGGRSSRGSSGGSSRSSGGSSGTLSNAGKTLLNSLSKNKAKGALGGGVAAALSQNINSLNSAYKSGKITASDVKLISKKLGL
jgi:hypothetical protein